MKKTTLTGGAHVFFPYTSEKQNDHIKLYEAVLLVIFQLGRRCAVFLAWFLFLLLQVFF